MHLVNRRPKQEQRGACSDYALQEGGKVAKLIKSGMLSTEDDTFINKLALELTKYQDTKFYTMHCTGEEQYCKLKLLMSRQIKYMACGDVVMI